MSSTRGADDSWWDEVYVGPGDDVPDTPRADSHQGTVDDWFDALSGVFGTDAADAAGDGGDRDGRDGRGMAGPERTGGPPTLVEDAVPTLPRQQAPKPEPNRPPQRGRERGPVQAPDPAAVSDAGPGPVRAAEPELGPGPLRLPDSGPELGSVPDAGPEPVRAAEPGPEAGSERMPDSGPELVGAAVPESEPGPARAAEAEPEAQPGRVQDPAAGPQRVPGGRLSDPVGDPREGLAALPVRPPRIPALRPDPRISTQKTPEPSATVEPDLVDPAGPAAGAQVPSAVRRPASASAPAPAAAAAPEAEPRPTVPLPHIGERPPTYDPEPTALPAAYPDQLGAVVPDTVLEGARYGTMTLRAASVRGDSARYRGSGRSDRLLVARFGEGTDALLVVVLATPAAVDDPSVADDACRQLAAAVGRSRAELLGDLRTGAQEGLRYGLQRLTARATVRLRGTGPDLEPDAATGALHALIAPLDPTSRLRAGFGVGPGGLLLLGDDAWYDAYAGRRLAQQQAPAGGGARPRPEDDGRFRFRVVVPEPGDVLLLCSDGLAQPLREEPAVSDFLADHWAHPHPPGMVDYLRHVQVRAKGYAADRTAAAVWED